MDDNNGVLNKGALVTVLTVRIEVKLTIEGIGLLLMIGDIIWCVASVLDGCVLTIAAGCVFELSHCKGLESVPED